MTQRRAPRFRSLTHALSAFTMLVCATAFLASTRAANAAPRLAPADRASIERAFAHAPADAEVDVIVTLAPDPATVSGIQALGPASPANRTILASLHARTAKLNQAVLGSLPAKAFTPRHQFQNFPGFSGRMTRQAYAALLADPRVATIEEVRPLEPHLAQGLSLMNGNTYRSQYTGQGMSIAICDTGIDTAHPVLGGGGFPNAKVLGGHDFGDGDADPRPSGQPHGTCCAAIAAGNSASVADYVGGVAPSAKLYSLKISYGSGGSATSAAMIAAWDWCVSHQYDNPAYPIMVVSTSFGGGRYYSSGDSASPGMTQAAQNAANAGITILASSGNDGYRDSLAWPACISSVISVGAVYDADLGNLSFGVGSDFPASRDAVTCYSNTASFLTLLAPSHNATTADITGSGGYSSGDYTSTFGGTSAACPYAAGAVACLQSAAKALKGSYLTPAQVRATLTQTGKMITDKKAAITKPRIDLAAAIASIVPTPTPTPTPTPVPNPKVTGIKRGTPATQRTNAAQLLFAVQFDRPVYNVTAANFSLAATGGQAGAAIASVSTNQNPLIYVTVNTAASATEGSIRLDLSNIGSIQDQQGLPLHATRTGDEDYIIDRQAPQLVSIARQNPPQPLTNAAQLIYRVTFSEAVRNIGTEDFAATGTAGQSGAIVTAVSASSGTQVDVTVSTVGGAEGAVRLDLRADCSLSDLAGNAISGGTQGASYQVDRLPPVALSIRRQSPAAASTNAAQAVFRVAFSEAVSSVAPGCFQLALTGGQAGATINGITPIDATTHDVAIKTVADALGTIRLDLPASAAIMDAAGNPLAAARAGDETFTVDRVPPRALSIRRQSPLDEAVGGGAVTFRVAFSRPVVGVGPACFSVQASGGQAGAGLTGIAASDLQNYDVTIASRDGGSGRIALNLTHPELIQDLLGNPVAAARTGDESYLIDLAPAAPTNRQPAAGAAEVPRTATLGASPFFDPDWGDTHQASQWQLRLAAGAPDYASPVYSALATTGPLSTLAIPPGVLGLATAYRWRVRHQDQWGRWSDWSTETEFVTTAGGYVPAPPETPQNCSPADAQAGVAPTAARLTGSPFRDADPGDAMTAAQFRVRAADGSYTSPAYDSGTVTSTSTTLMIPPAKLTPLTAYAWQLRYRDTRGLWSEWSAETTFTTGSGGQLGAPDGLAAFPGATSVLLAWPASPDPAVTGYNLYRAAAQAGPFTKLNAQPLTAPQYLDNNLAPQSTWWYCLAATAPGQEGPRSLPIAATVGQTVITMSDLRGEPGDTLTQRIAMRNPNAIASDGMALAIRYDPALLRPLAVRKTALTDGFIFSDNHATAAGTLAIAAVGSGKLIQGQGGLLEIEWRILPAAPLWTRSELYFSSVELSDAQARPLSVDFTHRAALTVAATMEPARLLSIARLNPSTTATAAAEVVFRATFSQNVNMVAPECFAVRATGGQAGPTGARVSSVGASRGETIDVTVGTAPGADGTVALALAWPNTILNDAALPLEGTAPPGEAYLIDHTPPRVASIRRLAPTARVIGQGAAVFRVTFTKPVRNVYPASFALAATDGQQGAFIAGLSASSGAVIDVGVNTFAGQVGTVRLDLADPGPIEDGLGQRLAAAATGDEDYLMDLAPDAPAPSAPTGGATGVSLTPTLRASAFFDPNVTDLQQASQWQLRAASDPADYTTTAFTWTQTRPPFDSVAVVAGKLQQATAYAWRVRYQDAWGIWSDWSPEAAFTTIAPDPLTAPAGLAASASPSAIGLTWPAHPYAGVTGYNLYRSAGNTSNYVKLNPSPTTATAFTDNAVQAGTTYYYALAALAGSRESARGDAVSARLGTLKITMDDFSADFGAAAWQTISLDQPAGVAGANLRVEINYDKLVLTPLAVTTTSLTHDFVLDSNIATANGALVITGRASGAALAQAQPGALMRVRWQVASNAAIGSRSPLAFGRVRLFSASGTEFAVDASDTATAGVTGTNTRPQVVSINRLTPSAALTRAAQVVFRVTFSTPVMNVSPANFSVNATAGQAGASVATLGATQGATIDCTVATVNAAAGDVRLDLANPGAIQDAAGNPLAGPREGDESYTVDRQPPAIVSINRWNPSDAVVDSSPVVFRITFSEPVQGVSLSNLRLATTGGQGAASIASLASAASGAAWDVKINTLPTQPGTLRLDLATAGAIQDAAGNTLAATRNGDQLYTINQPPATPAPASPASAATGVALAARLAASAFSDPNAGDTHKASRWQLRKSTDSYATPVFDSGASATALTAVNLPTGALAYSTAYAWRVRYQDSHDAWSVWSAERTFTTEANQPPAAPTNLAPAAGALRVALPPTLAASAFSDPNAGDRQRAAQWQLRAATSPADYSTTLFDSGDTGTELASLALPPGRLAKSTSYAWRVRHQDSNGLWSDWSRETSFTTAPNTAPNRPDNQAPAPGSTGVSVTPTLTASAFSDADPGDTQSAAQWQLREASAPSDYSVPAFDSGASPSALASLTLPSGALRPDTAYCWRARVADAGGDWSPWSRETSFTTLPPPNNVGTLKIANGFLNGIAITSASAALTVTPGAAIDGALNLAVNNLLPGATVAPLAWTATWGDRAAQVRPLSAGLASGAGTLPVELHLAAPPLAGDYALVFAFGDSTDAAQLLSSTAAPLSPAWSDGNDAGFDWTAPLFAQARASGAVRAPQLTAQGARNAWLAAAAIDVHVIMPPNTPLALAPIGGAAAASLTPTLKATAFSDPAADSGHQASEWQIRAAASPADYSTPAFDSGATPAGLTSLAVPGGRLAHGTVHAWRVRYQGTRDVWSGWSAEAFFVTPAAPLPNRAPATPVNQAPADGQGGVSLTPGLTASAFSDPDAGDTMTASQWRLRSETGAYDAPAFDSGVVVSPLTTYAIPGGQPLAASSTYWWQLRVRDAHGAWSPWSAETRFITMNASNDSGGGTPPPIPPAAPEGLGAVPGARSTWLTWSLGADPAIEGYNIYRAAGSGQAMERLNGTPVRGSEYMDENLAAGPYAYAIAAVGADRLESSHTQPIRVTVGTLALRLGPLAGEPGQVVTQRVASGNPNRVANRGLELSIAYDPAMLTPLAVRTTALTAAFAIDTNPAAAAGTLRITGLDTPERILGEGDLFEIDYRIKPGLAYWSTSSLGIASARFADDTGAPLTIQPAAPATLTVKAPFIPGDVDRDGRVSILDAVLQRLVILGQRIPTGDQRTAGDLNGDTLIDSADQVLLLQLLVNQNARSSGADAANRAGSLAARSRTEASPGITLQAAPAERAGDRLIVPLVVSDLSGMAGMDIVINTDPTRVELLSIDRGPALADWAWSTAIERGQLRITTSNARANLAGSATVARLVLREATAWRQTAIRIAAFKASGPAGENLARRRAVAAYDVPLIKAPLAPLNLAPASGAAVPSLKPTLKSSAFADESPDARHAASRWQLRRAGTAADYTQSAFDSGETAAGLTSFTLPAGSLVPSAAYGWRVRHKNDLGAWGPWSAETIFSTPAKSAAGRWGDYE